MEFIPKEKDEAPDTIQAPQPAGVDILSELGGAGQVIVHERLLEVNGTPRTFWIRELSYRQLNKVNEQKWRRAPGGALEFDVKNADNNVTAWTIHLGVVTPHGDSSDRSADNWAPLFTVEQILGTPEQRMGRKLVRAAQPGLLDQPSEAARLFIFALQGLVWEANPTLDPTILMSAVE